MWLEQWVISNDVGLRCWVWSWNTSNVWHIQIKQKWISLTCGCKRCLQFTKQRSPTYLPQIRMLSLATFVNNCYNVSARLFVLGGIKIEWRYNKRQLNSYGNLWYRFNTTDKPRSVYSAYIHVFKIKFTFFNRIIPIMHNHLQVLEEVLQNNFIPALTGELAISEIFQH